MVERRRFGDFIPHAILLLGVAVVAFPVAFQNTPASKKGLVS